VPYAGVVYDLGEHYSVYASYSTIFKPQGERDEQGKALDPLEGRSYEMGLKAEFFDGRLNASAALFQLDQDNFAQPTGGKTPDGQDAYRALMGVRTKGYELEMSGSWPRAGRCRWVLHKIARQAGTKVTTLEPENQFSLHTSYRLRGAWQGLTLGGGARWQDSTFGEITNPATQARVVHRTQPYWLLDAMARYNSTIACRPLNVNNLLDKALLHDLQLVQHLHLGRAAQRAADLRTTGSDCGSTIHAMLIQHRGRCRYSGRSNTNTSASLPFSSVSWASSLTCSASPASRVMPLTCSWPRATCT
jgi:outer membrane receptor for ferric coprogen and ferric-rhodotorulic acid